MIDPDAIRAAAGGLGPHIRRTPLEYSSVLSERGGAEVFLKMENLQVTGSFKVRGALNRLLALSSDERRRGVVSASSGNHGAAVAYGARRLGIEAEIFVPTVADPSKRTIIEELGARVRVHGDDCVVAEVQAREVARAEGKTYISPYNDPAVVAGQGTIGLELRDDPGGFDAVFVALGGGGLISGIALAMRGSRRPVEIVAASPERSPAMHACLEAGRIVEVECAETLSDATAGGVEEGAITFDLCRKLVDRSIVVDETEIAAAMRLVLERHRTLIEGAAGVAVAAYLRAIDDYRGRRVAIVLCGANVGVETLRRVLIERPPAR